MKIERWMNEAAEEIDKPHAQSTTADIIARHCLKSAKKPTSEFNRGFKAGIEAMSQQLEVALGVIEQHQFSLVCSVCDADGPDSRKAAREAGWRDIIFDDGMSHNFLGICRDCDAQEKIENENAKKKAATEARR